MKFGQLIQYNVRNIILEKSYTKHGLFLLYPKLRAIEMY